MKKVLFFILFIMISVSLIAQEADPFEQITKEFKDNNFQQVITLSQDFLKKYPTSENAQKVKLYMGISYLKLNDNDNAIQVFQEHIIQYPNFDKNEQVRFLIGKLYFTKGDYASAKKALNEMMTRYPNGEYTQKAKDLLDQMDKTPAPQQQTTPQTTPQTTEPNPNTPVKVTALATEQSEYSWTKMTWTKIASAACIIASPIFLLIGSHDQSNGDSIYNNNYLNATTSADATSYFNQATSDSKNAATMKTMSIVSLGAGIGLFALDYFVTGRVSVMTTGKQVSLNYRF